MPDSSERLYADLSSWWPLLSAPQEYAEEATIYGDLLEATCNGPLESLLELGCGGGNNAVHLKHRFAKLVLTDLSPGMLAVSENLNPECEHVVGDMRSVRLERIFDAVFVHDAVCYMKTEEDLRRAIKTAWVHCRPGGAVLFAPDYVRETFPGTDSEEGGHDEPPEAGPSEGPASANGDSTNRADTNRADVIPRGLRYLAWVWDPDPEDNQYITDYAYLLRERDGSIQVVHDRHVEGLFSRETWLRLLQDIGFQARIVPLEHSEVAAGVHEMFVATRPAQV